ncbi:MAG: penicillin-binding protein 2 [Lautropia sp.]|nr:penicillin-binding protein 2 [Lautropia sp.]
MVIRRQGADTPVRFKRRLMVAMVGCLAGFGLLAAQSWHLQVVNYDKYHALAEDNRITMLPLPPQRGRILDRNGIVLAEDIYTPALEIATRQAHHIDRIAAQLGRIVPISALEILRFKRLAAGSKNADGTIPLKTRLTDQEAARLAAVRFRFDGIEIKTRPHRNYPLGTTAAHVIGHIGRISKADNDALAKNDQTSNYAGSTHIGKLGLEQSYEAPLHGKVGLEEVEITASGRPVRALSRQSAVPGQDIRLALDIPLQQQAEELLAGRRGALVAIEPHTGEILAFVSEPSFDPNLFVDGIDHKNWRLLNDNPDHPLLNRPLRGTYPPGSTYKPFMALATLEYGVRRPEDTIQDPGFWMLGKHRFRDSKPQGHGRVDLFKSIVVSSDTYYYGAAYDLGVDRIHDFMKPWGFGQLTGIDLPDEQAGILPSPAWKKQRFKQPWLPGETPSIGIGQGYNAFTILQLAHATATLANNGLAQRPHLVTHIGTVMPAEDALASATPMQVSPRNLALVQHAMTEVTRQGTARAAFLGAEYDSAGKTGTAQVIGIRQNEKYDEKKVAHQFHDHSLYIGYAPARNPRIALALVVENGGFGAHTAAPIARKIFDFYLLGKSSSPHAPPEEVQP